MSVVLIEAVSKEFASDGITVNAYCPGIVGPDMWVQIDRRMAEITGTTIGASYEKFVGDIALGRAEAPEDYRFRLLSGWGPDSDYMTGQAPLNRWRFEYR